MSDRKQLEQTVRHLVQVSSRQYGDSLFETMCLELARTLRADYTLIGTVDGKSEDHIRTLVAVADGKIVGNFSYDLAGTPCENVMAQGSCSYPEGAAELFPRDLMLLEMDVEGYVGVPLFASSGKPLGIMAALYRRKLTNQSFAESVLQIFSTRVSSEIEHSRAEEALRESEDRHRNILHTALDGFVLLDLRGKILEVNQAYCQMSGYTQDELLTMNVADLDAVDSPEGIASHARAIRSRGYDRFETRHRHRSGTRFDVEISVQHQDFDGGRLVAFVRDISEQKRIKSDLETIQRRYFEFVNASSDLVTYWKVPEGVSTDLPIPTQVEKLYQSVCIECNRASWEFLGLSGRDDLLGKTYGQLLADPTMDEAFATFIQNNYRLSGHASYEIFPDGSEYHGLSNWHGTVENGCLTHVWVSSKNTSDLKQAEARVRAEMTFTDTALDAQEDTFFLFDFKTGRALRWNRAFREISGYSDAEISELPAPVSYYSPEDLTRITTFMEPLVQDGDGTIEVDLIRKDGGTVPTEYSVSVIYDEDSQPEFMISIGRDISERRQAEEEKKLLQMQFHQAQKLDSIGRLAGGVAHDLNNLLSPILGYGEILANKISESDPRRGMVIEILEAGTRARNLVGQLLAFSRKQALEFTPIDLNQLLRKFENLLRRTIREDVRITLDLAPSLPVLKGDVGQLEQVIMNLAVNAQDAMPEGGDFTIATAHVDLDGRYMGDLEGVEPGPYVMLMVSDTGCGMEAETREHIFEPFFTTKDSERGSGLGLATVFGIVKQHGGNLWVCSEPGQGTTFRIYLPATEEALPEPRVAKESAPHTPGTETILLVEDNDPVREMAASILRLQGYTVLDAPAGPEALDLLRTHGETIHLLLTDVVMPGMNGRELYQQVVRTHGHIKVLYMSGYIDDVIAHHGVMDPGVHFIQKPFSLDGLAAKVRAALSD